MNIDIKNRVVWITGTSRGIGFELAQLFAQRGAVVVATLRTWNEKSRTLPALLQAHSPESVVLKQDVSIPEDAERVAAEIKKRYGRLHVLVNNAGFDPRQPADTISNSDWRTVLGSNLDGAWFSARAAIPIMKEARYGKILQVGSITTFSGLPHLSHYIASKAGLVGLTRGLARDLGPYGIRVNCIVLGAVQVEKETRIGIGTSEEILAMVNSRQCLPGRILPKDVEPTFAFFASAASDAITGQSLIVDQGWCFQ